jgi:predicted nucleic-acid-binding protein
MLMAFTKTAELFVAAAILLFVCRLLDACYTLRRETAAG